MKRYNYLLNRYNVSANRYNDSETVITVQKSCNGYAGAGTRVRIWAACTTGFFQKKLTGPSQTRTRVPFYPPIPGHGYGYRVPDTDTRVRIVPGGF
jgi:hypothetical protein